MVFNYLHRSSRVPTSSAIYPMATWKWEGHRGYTGTATTDNLVASAARTTEPPFYAASQARQAANTTWEGRLTTPVGSLCYTSLKTPLHIAKRTLVE